MNLLRRRLSGALLPLLVAACTTLPPTGPSSPPPQRPARDSIQTYTLEARFSIRAGGEGQSGRIAWSHQPEGDKLLFLSPLGQGMATLESDATGARLEMSDKRSDSAPTPDELADRVLGRPLPLRRVPRWILGLCGPAGSQTRDKMGRALEIQEDGWRVEYLAYESDEAEALPTQLRISRGDVELKLRLDGWSLQ